MSVERYSLICLTIGFAGATAGLRLAHRMDLAPILIGVATVSGGIALALQDSSKRSATALPSPFGYQDAVVLSIAVMAAGYHAAMVTPAATLSVAASYLVKTAWEEMWFRGLWMGATGMSLLGIILGSVLFCMMHVPASPGRAAALLAVGFAFSTLRRLGVGLVALILLHAAFNTIASSGRADFAILPGLILIVALTFAVGHLQRQPVHGATR